MPSSTSATRTIGITGPNVSSRITVHVVGDVHQHGRRVEVARPLRPLAAGQGARAPREGGGDLRRHGVPSWPVVASGPRSVSGADWVADAQTLG